MKEKEFLKKINDMGGLLYIVGGWVRDKVMERESHDKDYAISGITESLFVQEFPKAKKVGNTFPVYLIFIDGVQSEVAFARTEIKTTSGHTGFSVTFDSDITIEDDLYRRDTTMNSMAWDLQKSEIIDPYGGVSDIKKKTIRATSKYFLDDPVRALRAARQSAQLEFNIECTTLEMMISSAKELLYEPKERIIFETAKALSFKKPSIYFEVLKKTKLLSVVFPWLSKVDDKTHSLEDQFEVGAFEHIMKLLNAVAEKNTRVEVRFAALIYGIQKSVSFNDVLTCSDEYEKKGLKVLNEINNIMTLPNLWYKCAEFIIREGMKAFEKKSPDKVVDLLLRITKHSIGYDGFVVIVSASGDEELPDYLANYEEYMKAIRSVRKLKIPKNLSGSSIGDWIRQKEIEAYKKASSQ